jgi:hypothetical protein
VRALPFVIPPPHGAASATDHTKISQIMRLENYLEDNPEVDAMHAQRLLRCRMHFSVGQQ